MGGGDARERLVPQLGIAAAAGEARPGGGGATDAGGWRRQRRKREAARVRERGGIGWLGGSGGDVG